MEKNSELNLEKGVNAEDYNHSYIIDVNGRVLIGIFLCTDRDANVILGSCSEYLREEDCFTEEPRGLGLVMVPGRHIVSIHQDKS
ncbi:conserved hypothetical protein [Pediculus humanus corporis]|uniref:Sm domain-containing protein n=1 Tax=Pediculus humanus subsp. corporis TaxID=121224 RepID=E0VL58_PEDHC|nr:uncharacterized protein Phum_PHUM281520 [Pediculus humanus corporis]EEB14114.1 conserved hypothetical protein [Pediculus humanus corporis]